MMSSGSLQITFPLIFAPKIHEMTDLSSGNFNSQKLMKLRIFTIKICTLHFFLESPNVQKYIFNFIFTIHNYMYNYFLLPYNLLFPTGL